MPALSPRQTCDDTRSCGSQPAYGSLSDCRYLLPGSQPDRNFTPKHLPIAQGGIPCAFLLTKDMERASPLAPTSRFPMLPRSSLCSTPLRYKAGRFPSACAFYPHRSPRQAGVQLNPAPHLPRKAKEEYEEQPDRANRYLHRDHQSNH